MNKELKRKWEDTMSMKKIFFFCEIWQDNNHGDQL